MASVASDTSPVQMLLPPSRPGSGVPADPSSGFADILDAAAGIGPAPAPSADAGAPSPDEGQAAAAAAPLAPPVVAQIVLLLQAGANLPSAKTQAANDPSAPTPPPPAPTFPIDPTLVALPAQPASTPPPADSDGCTRDSTIPTKSAKSDKPTDNANADATVTLGPSVTTAPPTPIVIAAPIAVVVPVPVTSPVNSAPSAAPPVPSATAPAIQTIPANAAPDRAASLVPMTSDDYVDRTPAQANSAPAVADGDDDDDSAAVTEGAARTPPALKPADRVATDVKAKADASAPDSPSNRSQPARSSAPETADPSANNPVQGNPIGSAPARAAATQTDDSQTPVALTNAPELKPSAAANAASANPASNPNALTPAAQQQPFATLIAPAPAHATPSSAPAVPIAGVAVEIAARVQDGQRRFEIRLDPPDLGRIEVRLDVDTSGRVMTHVTTDRSDTLDLLRRDAPSLERALQSAGLTTDNGALQFSLRQQAFAGREQTFQGAAPAAQLIVPDSDGAPLDAALRRYGQLMGLGSGVDIRV